MRSSLHPKTSASLSPSLISFLCHHAPPPPPPPSQHHHPLTPPPPTLLPLPPHTLPPSPSLSLNTPPLSSDSARPNHNNDDDLLRPPPPPLPLHIRRHQSFRRSPHRYISTPLCDCSRHAPRSVGLRDLQCAAVLWQKATRPIRISFLACRTSVSHVGFGIIMFFCLLLILFNTCKLMGFFFLFFFFLLFLF